MNKLHMHMTQRITGFFLSCLLLIPFQTPAQTEPDLTTPMGLFQFAQQGLSLPKNIDINATDNEDNTNALHVAIKNHDVQAARWLIENNININHTDSKYWTPLHYAVIYHHRPCLQLLLEHNAKVDIGNHGNLCDNIRSFFKGLGATYDKGTPLHYAVHYGRIELVEDLLNSGADPNSLSKERYQSPLTVLLSAVKRHPSNFELIQLLVERGADPSTILEKENFTILDSLLLSSRGTTSLKIVKYLVENGAPINPKIKELRRTPLHAAVEQGDMSIIDYLIEQGADLFAIDSSGYSLLETATGNEKDLFPLVKLLVDRGFDVNGLGVRHHSTPLSKAASSGHLDSVKYLVEHGADLEMRSGPRDHTPLLAIMSGYEPNLEVVRFLCESGADIYVSGYRLTLFDTYMTIREAVMHYAERCKDSAPEVYDYIKSIWKKDSFESRKEQPESLETLPTGTVETHQNMPRISGAGKIPRSELHIRSNRSKQNQQRQAIALPKNRTNLLGRSPVMPLR